MSTQNTIDKLANHVQSEINSKEWENTLDKATRHAIKQASNEMQFICDSLVSLCENSSDVLSESKNPRFIKLVNEDDDYVYGLMILTPESPTTVRRISPQLIRSIIHHEHEQAVAVWMLDDYGDENMTGAALVDRLVRKLMRYAWIKPTNEVYDYINMVMRNELAEAPVKYAQPGDKLIL